jgi:hypothetical protein
MAETTIARPYARAIFNIAKKKMINLMSGIMYYPTCLLSYLKKIS